MDRKFRRAVYTTIFLLGFLITAYGYYAEYM